MLFGPKKVSCRCCFEHFFKLVAWNRRLFWGVLSVICCPSIDGWLWSWSLASIRGSLYKSRQSRLEHLATPLSFLSASLLPCKEFTNCLIVKIYQVNFFYVVNGRLVHKSLCKWRALASFCIRFECTFFVCLKISLTFKVHYFLVKNFLSDTITLINRHLLLWLLNSFNIR